MAEPLANVTWPNARPEDIPVPMRRSTDATKLTVPLPAVVAIVGVVLAVAVFIWTSQAQMQSDVRVILTQMEADKRVAVAEGKVQEMNNQQIRDTLGQINKRLELQQMQIAEIQKSQTQRR